MAANGMTRVLVIDDEAPIRLLCRVNLEAEGMEVLEASDGPSGLEVARGERPDVVLLDVMMPGLDGWRVAEELLEDVRTNGIPIIFLTARAEFRDRARGLDIGGVDYVTKPFNPLELAPLVDQLLDRIEKGERDEAQAQRPGRSDERRCRGGGEAGSGDEEQAARVPEQPVRLPGDEPEAERRRRPEPPVATAGEPPARRGEERRAEGGEPGESVRPEGDEIEERDSGGEEPGRDEHADETVAAAARPARGRSRHRRLRRAEDGVRRREPEAQEPGASG